MPTLKNHRRGGPEEATMNQTKNRKGRLAEKSSSFHGGWNPIPAVGGVASAAELRRPNTVPDLKPGNRAAAAGGVSPESRPKLRKLLLNVTIQGSLGAVQVVMTPESSVGDLVAAAVRQYAKEARRPILPSIDSAAYDLHYSQFSLESLDRQEELMNLGSRNFFLCTKRKTAAEDEAKSCSKQAGKASNKMGLPWLKFMDFLL